MTSVADSPAPRTHPDPGGERTTDPTPPVAAQVNGPMDTPRSRPDVPSVTAVKVRPSRSGGYSVTITCPHCGRRHLHGLPPGWTTVGHRVSHCDRDVDHVGYHILIPAGAL